jgi:hypothetical protein
MRDIFKFIAKIGVLSFAFVCMTSSSFVVNAQESSVTSGKIQIDNQEATKASEGSSKSTSVFKSTDSAPYKFKQGQRDPFVPFGGNVAPTPLPSTFLSNSPEDAKKLVEKAKEVEEKDEVEVEQPIVLPVMVTGVLIGGDHSFAILAPAEVNKDTGMVVNVSGTPGGDRKIGGGAKASDSFLVSVGDKIGEYTVQSITNDKVVLIWQGKPYSIPVQKYTGKSKDGKVVVGEAPEQPTLPVPEIKKKEEKKKEEPAKADSSKEGENKDQANPSDKEQKNEQDKK